MINSKTIAATPNILDKAIRYVNPGAYNKRMKSRLMGNFAEDQGYITPDSRRKTMKGVHATANSPDRDTIPKLKGSRALSRDMYTNTPFAVAAIKRVRTNVVGAGLKPKPTIDAKYLGLSAKEARKWETAARREFYLWGNSKHSDYSGRLNFWDNQALAFVSTLLNGDTFYMLPWVKRSYHKDFPYETKLRMIEADLVRNPPLGHIQHGQMEKIGGSTIAGIEMSKSNYLKAAWFADHYASYGMGAYGGKYIRVEKYSRNGRTNWHQLAEFDRINQRRGMPYLAPVVDMLKTMTRHTESELVAALVASTFTVFVKDQSAMGGTLNPGFTPTESAIGGGTDMDDDGNQTTTKPRDEDELDLELGNGLVHYLDDDKDITIADPKRPNAAYEPFFRAMATQIAAALELSVEQVLIQFNTSYTAARAALIEVYKFFMRRRQWLVRELCVPTYTEVITEAVVKGRLVAPGFFDDPAIAQAWCGAMWIGMGKGQIDPMKESKAAALNLGTNLTTHQQEYMERTGEDWDDMIERKQREEELLKEKGFESKLDPGEITGPDGVKNKEDVKKTKVKDPA